MDTRTLSFWIISLIAWPFSVGKPLFGDTISATYSFTGTAQNEVIANGSLTADGVAFGSVNDLIGVVFDTHDDVNLTTLQNNGTFTMIFPDGDTVFGNLYENDSNVSLGTFSGPFTQMLTFTGGTGQFANASGTLIGGGFIYPTSYTTSGAGTLTAPSLVASPEPGSGVLLLIGFGAIFMRALKRCGKSSNRALGSELALRSACSGMPESGHWLGRP